MKKVIFVYFLMINSMFVFSQNHTYGLSQSDLNLVLGQFVPSVEIWRYRWIEESFSWGRQTAVSVDTEDDAIKIDYYASAASSFGKKYEKHLMISNTGFLFLVTNIEKTAANKFTLTLITRQYSSIKYVGQITLTFLDGNHIVIDNTNCLINGWFDYMILWKSAGPTITVNNKKDFRELPDFNESETRR